MYFIQLPIYCKQIRSNLCICFSFEAVKPLGRVEVIPSPYVTESTRVALLLPTFEHQIKECIQFITHYEKTCMEHQDNTFLMLVIKCVHILFLNCFKNIKIFQVFMYRSSSNKDKNDVFVDVKTLALQLSEKYKADGSRIAWVSIKLPEPFTSTSNEGSSSFMLSSMYGKHEILSLVVTDLALRKIGLESLVMICSNGMSFKPDILNRVIFICYF